MATKVLYTSGCSLTDGSELGNKRFNYDESKFGPSTTRYPYFSSITPEHRQWMEDYGWPAQLGQLLGVEQVVNTGKGGGSNQRIVRRVFKDVPALLEKFQPSEILVVIGMTNGERYEVVYDGHFFQVVPEMIRFERDRARKRQGMYAIPAVQDFFDTVDTYFSSAHEAVGNYLRTALIIKSFLDSLGIRNFIFPATGWIFNYAFHCGKEPYVPKGDEHVRLFKLLKPDWFYRANEAESLPHFVMNFLPEKSFHGFTVANDFPRGTGGHPLEEAHQAWAKNLLPCVV